jgi:Zn-dependent peptidase ImmA (M78 family)
MNKKNFTIDLFGSKWKIKFVDTIKNQDSDFLKGLCDPNKMEIQIANTVQGIQISEEEQEETLYHEIVHAIFNAGQYMHSFSDEPLVEWTARCIFYLKKKGVFK